MSKVSLCLAQSLSLLFCASAVCDVNVRADITLKFSAEGVSRNPTFNHPTIFSVSSLDPVLHSERLLRVEGRKEAIKTPLHIVWMHTFGPSKAYFLLHSSACELEPWSVEI